MGRSGPTRTPGCETRRTEGITLVEVVIGIVLFTIGLLGLGAVLVSNQRSQEMAAEEAVVSHSFRNMLETLRSTPYTEIATTYQDFAFTVGEIGARGTVRLFLNETDTSPEAANLGLPRDLDGDGAATRTDVTGGYALLPVRITISWSSFSGPQSRSLYALLAREE